MTLLRIFPLSHFAAFGILLRLIPFIASTWLPQFHASQVDMKKSGSKEGSSSQKVTFKKEEKVS